MIMILSVYGVGVVAVMALLALMLLKVGTLLSECPETGRSAKAAAVTVATGFTAIGLGGALMVGAVIPLVYEPLLGLLAALGFSVICLGLGFTHAVTTLRAVVAEAEGLKKSRVAEPNVSATAV